jgi:hypothetical protein
MASEFTPKGIVPTVIRGLPYYLEPSSRRSKTVGLRGDRIGENPGSNESVKQWKARPTTADVMNKKVFVWKWS